MMEYNYKVQDIEIYGENKNQLVWNDQLPLTKVFLLIY